MRKLIWRLKSTTLAIALIVAIALSVVPDDTAFAGHSPFTQSTGIYRIPYTNGTSVTVSNDHHLHNPVNRIDMGAADANEPIVAAASGIIRGIVDIHGDSNDLGNSTDEVDALEHSCGDGSPAVQDSVVPGFCSDYNNYVWIEHPNGEWSKYTHFQTGSVTANNWVVGDPIVVGQVIGIEGDVGRATGRHLHFEIGWPDDPTSLTPFAAVGGFMVSAFGTNRAPRACDSTDTFLYSSNTGYTANPCNNTSPTADAGGTYSVDEGSTVLFDGTGSSDAEGLPLTYLWSPSDGLDDDSLSQSTYTGVDDGIDLVVNLTVYDRMEALAGSDSTTVTVTNVKPDVTSAVYINPIDEGSEAAVESSFDDPGALDTHTATIDWDDGSLVEGLGAVSGLISETHLYIDDGSFDVKTTVEDDDGGVGFDVATVTVNNVAPTVYAVGDSIDEGGSAVVSATFFDPGVLDTHTASIDWDDGTPPEVVTIAALEAGISHSYGDNALYSVVVTVTDDDDDSGDDTVNVLVSNIDPTLELEIDNGTSIIFPGGEYVVFAAGDEIEASADGSDPGSDDLTFDWAFGESNIHYNDGVAPDPVASPGGIYPFNAEDSVGSVIAEPGVESVNVVLTDDDGGSDSADLGAIVTGNADSSRSVGWWKHQYSGKGSPQLDDATLQAYLDIVNAVSSVFSESVSVTTIGEADSLLSSSGKDDRDKASVELLTAWLHFASGAVSMSSETPINKNDSIVTLTAMFEIEAVILDPDASKKELRDAGDLARRVKFAE